MGIQERYDQRRRKRHSARSKNRFIGFDIDEKAEVEAHMRNNFIYSPNPEVLRGKILSMSFRFKRITTIGVPCDGEDLQTIQQAIREAFVGTSEDCGYQLRKLVMSAVKKAVFLTARTNEDHVELTSRASVTGQSAGTAANLILAFLTVATSFKWNVRSIKPEWFLRVRLGTASRPDEMHYGMRVIVTYLTRDEDDRKNVMERDVVYQGSWRFGYSQEAASPTLPNVTQGSSRLTTSDLDQESSRLTENPDQSNASWSAPGNLGIRAQIYLEMAQGAQRSHQRRKQRNAKLADYGSLFSQSPPDRTGIIAEWLAEKLTRAPAQTQSEETIVSRLLHSVSDHLSTFADVHRGSVESKSTRSQESQKGNSRDPNVITDTLGRKVYSPLHGRFWTAWNDAAKARRQIRNVHGYKVARQQEQSGPKETRPKKKSRNRGRHHQSRSSAGGNSSYPSQSQQQETVSIPMTDDRYPGRPGIDHGRSDSMYTGQEERVLTSEEVAEAQACLATIEVELGELEDDPNLIGKDRQAIWERKNALINEQKELRHILGLPMETSQQSVSYISRPDETGASVPPSSYPGQSSTFGTLASTSRVH